MSPTDRRDRRKRDGSSGAREAVIPRGGRKIRSYQSLRGFRVAPRVPVSLLLSRVRELFSAHVAAVPNRVDSTLNEVAVRTRARLSLFFSLCLASDV